MSAGVLSSKCKQKLPGYECVHSEISKNSIQKCRHYKRIREVFVSSVLPVYNLCILVTEG